MTDTLALDPSGLPDIPAPAAPASGMPSRSEPFRFTGAAGEYFRIWIVNLFLCIVTVGLYSPWAKVRKKRYFHGHTWLAGANFEYHGDPVAILKGRLLAFAAFMVYSTASHYSERVGHALLLAMLPALPWLLVQSFAFNAANTSYRNLRFRFTGTYRQALAAVAPLALVPFVALLTPDVEMGEGPRGIRDWGYLLIGPLLLLFMYPYVIAKVKLFHLRNAAFGATPFECDAGAGRFYAIYVAGGLVFAGVMTVAGFAMAGAVLVSPGTAVAIIMGAYLLGGALSLAYVNASTINYLFGATRLRGAGRFHSHLEVWALTKLYMGNLVIVAITFGLGVPWAAVRTARYRASRLSLEIEGGLDALAARSGAGVRATGEEMGEMFGFDLSL